MAKGNMNKQSRNDENQAQTQPSQASSGDRTSKAMTSSQRGMTSSGGFDGENVLDQFSTFMKANWRPLLMEAVAAGVTAYMTYASNSGNKTNRNAN